MKSIFKTNATKASVRVNTNSLMMGSLFFILTLIWSLNPLKFSPVVIVQIVLAIPLLFVSTLAYSKLGYSEDTRTWDALGWFTNNVGSIFILNVVGLMTAMYFHVIAIMYFVLIVLLMGLYSTINVFHRPEQSTEKVLKFIFFVAILLAGGILPLAF